MRRKTTIRLSLLAALSASLYAVSTIGMASPGSVALPTVVESIPFDGSDAQFDAVLLHDSKRILDLYQPVLPDYLKVLSKSVSGGASPEIELQCQAEIFFVTADVAMRGVLRMQKRPCGESALGYEAVLDLSHSDSAIRDNYSEIDLRICASRQAYGTFSLTAYPTLIQGPNPGLVAGKIRQIVTQQVEPIMNAFVASLKEASQ